MFACKQLIFLTDFVCVVPTAFHCSSYFSEWLLLRGRSASSLTCKVNKLHKTCPSICTYTVGCPFLSTLKKVIYDIQYPLNKYLHFPLVLLYFPFARDSSCLSTHHISDRGGRSLYLDTFLPILLHLDSSQPSNIFWRTSEVRLFIILSTPSWMDTRYDLHTSSIITIPANPHQ